MPDETEKRDDERSFEKLTQRLEEVVESLESGGLPLDESLKLFEEGVRISRQANTRLEEAERRVEELLGDGSETSERSVRAERPE
jgi:exodeoxyribonuclease VII small subunit